VSDRIRRAVAASLAATLAAAIIAAHASWGIAAPVVPPGNRRALPAMVAKALPAVVSVSTREIEQDQFNRRVVRPGMGSGFIVDRRGHILTNNHVVEGASEIKVTLTDGRGFRATLVGRDAFSDLAVLRIDGAKLPVLPLGDSAKLRVAQTVIAIGNPLWIEGGPTVTVGVVSALGRSMEERDLPVLHDLIQTDAAINHGNSGGPLLDLSGRVIGINTALIDSAHGIGFAISINSARPVLHALIANGRIDRTTLGLNAVSVTPQVAWTNELPMERGALVTRVDENGPAAAAGIQSGDVITTMQGRAITDLHQLHDAMFRRRAGDVVDIGVWRAGEQLTVRAALGAMP
jgi:serine protease Do